MLLMKTTVLLADDNKELLAGICSIFNCAEEIRIVGVANDGLQAIHLVRKLKPDVVVMDITMPYMNGIDATRKIISESPGTKIIALSMHSEWAYVANMIEAGASGYMLKENILEELQKAITIVAEGGTYISKRINDSGGILVKEKLSRRQKAEGKGRDL
jgi:DNA-binding NarL/FixJ family response regulator